jgi:nucleotide-binding universal stress UspA family protein
MLEEDMLPQSVEPRTRFPAARPERLVHEPAALLRHVLVPSDLSEASEGAFEHARFLARRFAAHLTLYHAVPMAHPRESGVPEVEREIWRRSEGAAREFLLHRAETVPVGCDVVVERSTSPPDALLAYIRSQQPDLTVMRTHGRRGLSRVLLGSVAERILREAGRPVLCVREPEHGVPLRYRRLLVPTDFSPSSRRAFPLAAFLARAFGADVIGLHVAPRPSVGSLSGIPEQVEAAVPDEARLAGFLATDFHGLDFAPRVETGSAWEVIVDTARDQKADLIVMSTQGHDSLADRVLGSHAERVLRHSPCPVLVTP